MIFKNVFPVVLPR